MRWLTALSIKNKVLIIGIVGVLGFAINLIYSFNTNSDNQTRLENLKTSDLPVLEHAIANINHLEKIKAALANAVDMAEEEQLEIADAIAGKLKQSLDDIQKIMGNDTLASDAGNKFNQYYDIARPLSQTILDGEQTPQELQPSIIKMNDALQQVEQAFAEYKNISYEHFVNTIHTSEVASDTATKLSFIIGIVVVLLLGATAFYMGKLIRSSVASVADSLKEIASGDGDLTKRLSTNSKDEIADLVTNFNGFVEKVHGVIGEVTASTAELITAADQMSSISSEASQTIHSQQSDIEQVAAAINEMSAATHNVANNAARAAEAAQTANNDTTTGHQVVNETIESLDELAKEIGKAGDVIKQVEADSTSIGVVLDVIKSIAEQTNLLALNAAIEAARAGDQGRGFAVVADEVRTLASRTQESTLEIEQIINGLQTNSSAAVKAMEQGKTKADTSVTHAAKAGDSLQSITHSVSTINDMNIEIASASDEQSTVAEEITKNITAIQDASTQTAQGSQQTATASSELLSLASRLQALVGQFKA